MKNSYALTLVFVLSVSFANNAIAGGCHLEYVTPEKEFLSIKLDRAVVAKINEIDQAMTKRGQPMSIVMVARSGESLKGFDILGDNPNISLQTYLDQIAQITVAQYDRDQNFNGIKIRKKIAYENSNTYGQPKFLPPHELAVENKLSYSHFGFLLKRDSLVESKLSTAAKSKVKDWMFVRHLLAECDESSNRYGQSDLFFSTFNQFFWDTDIVDQKNPANKALIVIPNIAIQKRLIEIINREDIAETGLHNKTYNVAATPFTIRAPGQLQTPDYHQLKDQNSNQWPLEMIAAATKPIGTIKNRTEAQDVLLATNYRPTLAMRAYAVFRGFKERLVCPFNKGSIFGVIKWDATNIIKCDDQVHKDLGIFQIITVDSVVDYMIRNSFIAPHIVENNSPGIYEVVVPLSELEEFKDKGMTARQAREKLEKKLDEIVEEAARNNPLTPEQPKKK